ncbi:MAG: response regulator transcription factor, partial [Chloroflexi bacterium]
MPQIQDTLLEEMHATRKTILIVEDDPYICEFLTMAISQETPYQALLAETGERAFEMIQHV